MDKVSILTSSSLQSNVSIPPRSELIALFEPTFSLAIRLQKVVSAISLFVITTALSLATITLWCAVLFGKITAIHAYFAARTVFSQSGKASYGLWNTKATRRLRNKIALEFAWTILGPGGNALFVMVFWPGWWLIICLILVVRVYTG